MCNDREAAAWVPHIREAKRSECGMEVKILVPHIREANVGCATIVMRQPSGAAASVSVPNTSVPTRD